MKVRGDEQSVTNSGKLLHARGPATAKAMNDVLLAPLGEGREGKKTASYV